MDRAEPLTVERWTFAMRSFSAGMWKINRMNAIDLLTLICAIGCGLVAGVFLAFSAGVMSALGRLPASQAITAMQAINVAIINPLFLGVFLGTAVACSFAIVVCLLRWDSPAQFWTLAGALLYLTGSFLVTMRCNVPRNEKLARVNPGASNAEVVWSEYGSTWTAWNHLRAACSLAAALCFLLRILFD